MKEKTVQGIILHAIPCQESHRIITLFSLEEGLLKIFVNYASKLGFLRPFNKVELLYREGKKDLDYYIEGKFLKSFPEGGLNELQIASEMAKSLLSTQEVSRACPKLYMIFETFLTTLPLVRYPETLLRAFQLKVLVHEDLLALSPNCSICHEPLYEGYYYSREATCKTHAQENSLFFTHEEFQMLLKLGTSRSLTELDSLELLKTLGLKVQTLMDAKGGT